MNLKILLTSRSAQNVCSRNILGQRTYASTSVSSTEIDLTSVETVPRYKDTIEETRETSLMRDKSRLARQHYNIQHGRRPYETFDYAYHHTKMQWKRRMFGRYGAEGSTVSPAIAWPTKSEIMYQQEYEKVAYPLTLKESLQTIAEVNEEKKRKLQERQELLATRLAKTAAWEKELYAKIAKKEAELQANKTRKERMVEEIRRHFGFKVNPKDEKFKKMLEQKEKEDKKLRKEAKLKEKREKLMARLLAGEQIDGLSKIKEERPIVLPKKETDVQN